MNSPLQQLSSPSTATATSVIPCFTSFDEEQFYAVIDRLKLQKALPQDSFPKELPFFNIASISKESQIKQLFEDASDPNLYKNLLKNMINLSSADKSPELISKTLSAMQVMNFAQIILFKVLPCPDETCPNQPREVAPGNQYKDYEYSCPFYHHDKDRRRIVITPHIEEEFIYKANYLIDSSKSDAEKEKHSMNYFESMYHPLYYKMFSCKRKYCNFSTFCPAFHSEEERKTWDNMFSNYIRKDRVSYVKDKQKYLDGGSNRQQSGYKAKSVTNSPNTYVSDFRSQTNKMNYHRLRNVTTQMQVGFGVGVANRNTETVENQGWRADTKADPQSNGKKNYNNNNNNNNRQRKNAVQKLKGFEQFEPKDSIVERMC